MIGKQLDLFGAPPKPPAKILVEEEVKPAEEQSVLSEENKPAAEQVEVPAFEEKGASDKQEENPPAIHVQFPASPKEESAIEEDLDTDLSPTSEAEIDYQEEEPLAVENDSIESTISEAEELDEHISADEIIISENSGDEDASEKELTEVKKAEEEGVLDVPEDEILFSRQYYTMRETSAMFNVNQSLIRFWENEFDILKPKKNRKGDRYFRPEDIKNLELIYNLLKIRRYTLDGAREYLKNKSKALDTFQLVQRLEKLKAFLLEYKAHL